MPASESKECFDVIIIGAGPAGLTAAYLLAKENISTAVIEADPEYVGGISRTVVYKGFRFDIGGHRFFSKNQSVEALWTEILPEEMLLRRRSSRIYYRNKFFDYPLKPLEVLSKLGIVESIRCVLSYFVSYLFPRKNVHSFEDWVSNQFGYRLFHIFFKTYTEKVWGTRCDEISADWAEQRINGFSLGKAIKGVIARRSLHQNRDVKTLITSFRYPRKGPGMLWEEAAAKFMQQGGQIFMGHRAIGCRFDAENKVWAVSVKTADGVNTTFSSKSVISSAPIKEVADMLRHQLTAAAHTSALKLKYRDFLTVALIVKDQDHFSDNWIYIHDDKVKVGRIQNFKSWSPELVPDPSYNCYGLEYFCFEDDGLWNMSDNELMEFAKSELVALGLASLEAIVDGCVVRQKKAYPVYDHEYQKHVEIFRQELEKSFPTMHLVGRNGMHKYNNQDHSMMTAMLTVKNILQGKRVYDTWLVNCDAVYHESETPDSGSSTSGLRFVPTLLNLR